jgi:hypothetical protein
MLRLLASKSGSSWYAQWSGGSSWPLPTSHKPLEACTRHRWFGRLPLESSWSASSLAVAMKGLASPLPGLSLSASMGIRGDSDASACAWYFRLAARCSRRCLSAPCSCFSILSWSPSILRPALGSQPEPLSMSLLLITEMPTFPLS